MSDCERYQQLLDLLAGPLGTLVLERLPSGHFQVLGRAPAWVGRVVQGEPLDPVSAFPFLEAFLSEAEPLWRGGRDSYLGSGFWTQPVAGAVPLHLTARAVKLGEIQLLMIVSSEDSYRDHQLLAQRGREKHLALEQLQKEIQRKEILVHCIVHDLAVPINAVTGSLGLLEEARERLPEELVKLVESASRASRRQATLVRDILDAFAAEQEALAHVERTLERAPDAVTAARAALEWVEHQARSQSVKVTLDVDEEEDFRVVGEASRLERVFTNLLENAVRVSPSGGRVLVRLSGEREEVRVTVDDEGPGIPEALRPRMFEKFVQGRGATGRMGLGLYFCAMMVRGWGGDVRCDRAPSGGARFEVRLLRPVVSRLGLGEGLVDAHQ